MEEGGKEISAISKSGKQALVGGGERGGGNLFPRFSSSSFLVLHAHSPIEKEETQGGKMQKPDFIKMERKRGGLGLPRRGGR